MTIEEQSRLANFRGMATMNGMQALEYHELLNKEVEVVTYTASSQPSVTYTVEVPKKKRGKK